MESNDSKNQANKDLFGDVNQESSNEKSSQKVENVAQNKTKNGNKKNTDKENKSNKKDNNENISYFNIIRDKEYGNYHKSINFEILTYHGVENSNSSYNEGNTRKARTLTDASGDEYTYISSYSIKRNSYKHLEDLGYKIARHEIEVKDGKLYLPEEKNGYIDLMLSGYADMNGRDFKQAALHMSPAISIFPANINHVMHTSGPYKSNGDDELVNLLYNIEVNFGSYMMTSIILNVKKLVTFGNRMLHYEDFLYLMGDLMHCLLLHLYGAGNHSNYLPAARNFFVVAYLSKSGTPRLHFPYGKAFKHEDGRIFIDLNVLEEYFQSISGGLVSRLDIKPKLSFGISRDIIVNSDEFTNYMISKDNVYFYLIKPDETGAQNNLSLPYTPTEALTVLRDYIIKQGVFKWLYENK